MFLHVDSVHSLMLGSCIVHKHMCQLDNYNSWVTFLATSNVPPGATPAQVQKLTASKPTATATTPAPPPDDDENEGQFSFMPVPMHR